MVRTIRFLAEYRMLVREDLEDGLPIRRCIGLVGRQTRKTTSRTEGNSHTCRVHNAVN